MKNIDKIEEDVSINPRLNMSIQSFEMFLQHPVLGMGFGGFNSPYKENLTLQQKYPHHIVLESASEMVLIGLGWLSLLLYLI